MIISHRHHYIFIKTKKTAGTSVEIALSEYCGPADVITPIVAEDEAVRSELGFRGPQNYQVPLLRYGLRDWGRLLIGRGRVKPFKNHHPAWYVRKYVAPRVWRTYYKFCIERNPWDKAISAWYFVHYRRYPRLEDYIHSATLLQLTDWHRYAEGDRLIVDEVFRYEDLAAGMARLRQRAGLPAVPRLPRAKAGFRKDRRPYWEVLGPAERERIAEVFAREIRQFGFQFGPTDSGATQ